MYEATADPYTNVYSIRPDGTGKTLLSTASSLVDVSIDQKWALLKIDPSQKTNDSSRFVAVNTVTPSQKFKYYAPKITQADCPKPQPLLKFWATVPELYASFSTDMKPEGSPDIFWSTKLYRCDQSTFTSSPVSVHLYRMRAGSETPVASLHQVSGQDSASLSISSVGQNNVIAFKKYARPSNSFEHYVRTSSGSVQKLPAGQEFYASEALSADGKWLRLKPGSSLIQTESPSKTISLLGFTYFKNKDIGYKYHRDINFYGSLLLQADANKENDYSRLTSYSRTSNRVAILDRNQGISGVYAFYPKAQYSSTSDYVAYFRCYRPDSSCDLNVVSVVNPAEKRTIDTVRTNGGDGMLAPELKW